MEKRIKYHISTPESVKNVAEECRKQIKENVKLKRAKEMIKCDCVFVFCPIVSRAGTDIEAALNNMNEELSQKALIFIVLHHTFNAEMVVSDSSKFVSDYLKSSGRLSCTVDCLFHEDQGLLKCERNLKALGKVAQFLTSERKNIRATRPKTD